MNSMLIIASLIAVAIATPVHRGLVTPEIAGSAPIVESPIAVGNAIVNFNGIAVGPAINAYIDPSGRRCIIEINISDTTGPVEVNVNAPNCFLIASPVVTPVFPEAIIPGPVNIVDGADNVIVPSPIAVGTPILPEVVVPGPVNIVDGADNVNMPTPVIVGAPIVPAPAVVLPETLN